MYFAFLKPNAAQAKRYYMNRRIRRVDANSIPLTPLAQTSQFIVYHLVPNIPVNFDVTLKIDKKKGGS
jgi:hypothetical protein